MPDAAKNKKMSSRSDVCAMALSCSRLASVTLDRLTILDRLEQLPIGGQAAGGCREQEMRSRSDVCAMPLVALD